MRATGELTASIVMPVYNGATTLPDVFARLEAQKSQHLVTNIFIIDDHSTDNSARVIADYCATSSYTCEMIQNRNNQGLAASYNIGITRAITPIVITMHQDIRLTDPASLERLLAPLEDDAVAASYPALELRPESWRHYSFWEQAMLSRFVGRRVANLTGKFDAFRRTALNRAGNFDTSHFRTAGEDGDLKVRLTNLGYRLAPADVVVEHIDSADRSFGVSNYLKKEAQLAEAQGVLLRRHGSPGLVQFALSFFREILLLSLLVPYLRYAGAALIIIYSIAYTLNVYQTHLTDPRILILPFVNSAALGVALAMSVTGFVRGSQRL